VLLRRLWGWLVLQLACRERIKHLKWWGCKCCDESSKDEHGFELICTASANKREGDLLEFQVSEQKRRRIIACAFVNAPPSSEGGRLISRSHVNISVEEREMCVDQVEPMSADAWAW